LDDSQPEKPQKFSRWLLNRLGLERGPTEIQQVIDESEERGLITPDEGDMIEGIFDLKQTVAREIMIPRTHVVAVPQESSREHVLKTIIESGHSRIPVYHDNLDHIAGILTAKDLLPLWLRGEDDFDISSICRPPFFVPETRAIKDLLNELREKKYQMAVIVDEYGGTSGIVTIEDIVEEIIGEIRDEHDVEEEAFLFQQDGSVLVSARVGLDDFEERFEISLPRDGYDTLGGFITHFLGRVPAKGEEMTYGGFRLLVHGGDQKKITRVLVVPAGADKLPGASTPPESGL
jgi:CBS domain containing-hemolysin-like protein